MPRIQHFAVCEKVIIDDVGVASLIGLFHEFTITVPAGSPVPPNALAPKDWAVFVSVEGEPGDEKRELSVSVQVLFPDKQLFAHQNAFFRVEPAKKAQIRILFQGFPVGQQGVYTVNATLLEAGRVLLTPPANKINLIRQEGGPIATA